MKRLTTDYGVLDVYSAEIRRRLDETYSSRGSRAHGIDNQPYELH
ncbi:hypothetical protein [Bradyrhizobium japonicum]|nr:hypothetical protein [Bradyrhizobium japonicum]